MRTCRSCLHLHPPTQPCQVARRLRETAARHAAAPAERDAQTPAVTHDDSERDAQADPVTHTEPLTQAQRAAAYRARHAEAVRVANRERMRQVRAKAKP